MKPVTVVLAAWLPLAMPAAASAPGQWNPQKSNTTASLHGLSIVNTNVVWASGTDGTYVRTTDGGRTWQADAVPDAKTLDFRSVYAGVLENWLKTKSAPILGKQFAPLKLV